MTEQNDLLAAAREMLAEDLEGINEELWAKVRTGTLQFTDPERYILGYNMIDGFHSGDMSDEEEAAYRAYAQALNLDLEDHDVWFLGLWHSGARVGENDDHARIAAMTTAWGCIEPTKLDARAVELASLSGWTPASGRPNSGHAALALVARDLLEDGPLPKSWKPYFVECDETAEVEADLQRVAAVVRKGIGGPTRTQDANTVPFVIKMLYEDFARFYPRLDIEV